MGACEFFTSAAGSTVREAFNNAVEDALYESGHGGYTGTIAEKDGFKSASSEVFADLDTAMAFAEETMQDDDHFCQDKWGPAAYVSFNGKDGKTGYLFFGWASS